MKDEVKIISLTKAFEKPCIPILVYKKSYCCKLKEYYLQNSMFDNIIHFTLFEFLTDSLDLDFKITNGMYVNFLFRKSFEFVGLQGSLSMEGMRRPYNWDFPTKVCVSLFFQSSIFKSFSTVEEILTDDTFAPLGLLNLRTIKDLQNA